MTRVGLACAVTITLTVGTGLATSGVTHAQLCPGLHAKDYTPVVDKKCGNWLLQRMDHVNLRFTSAGWQLDNHGKRYILVANYRKSESGGLNFEYYHLLDRALLVDDADLRIGKARPLREDRVDLDLENNAVGLYLEQGYAEAMGMLPR